MEYRCRPERSQLAQAPGAGERAGLVREAFHQAAVAKEYPGAWVNNVMAGRLNSLASSFSAMAMPTALAMPWPRGPVGSRRRVYSRFRVAGSLAGATGELLQVSIDRA